MQPQDSAANLGAISSARAPGSAQRPQGHLRVVGGLMVLAAIASAGCSLYWFYTSLEPRSHAREMHKDLEELQRQRQSPPDKEAEGLAMMFGMLGGVGPQGMDQLGLLAEAVALSAEKSAYQYLCLALALGFPGIWLVWSARSRLSGRTNG